MAFYTRKGDKGDTYFFGSGERFSKSSERAEALGSIDEANSLIGVCRIKLGDFQFLISGFKLAEILKQVQEDLFVVQAELAGADKKISQEKIDWLEKIIDFAEAELPEIKSFFLAGGSELSAVLDFARAISRKAERSVVSFHEKTGGISPETLAYLNRLSSLLYALARFANFKLGREETSPSYK
jgi:cob(I)alamin adenosyltransferase